MGIDEPTLETHYTKKRQIGFTLSLYPGNLIQHHFCCFLFSPIILNFLFTSDLSVRKYLLSFIGRILKDYYA